eukprot:3400782-Amphidinium_carterae.2
MTQSSAPKYAATKTENGTSKQGLITIGSVRTSLDIMRVTQRVRSSGGVLVLTTTSQHLWRIGFQEEHITKTHGVSLQQKIRSHSELHNACLLGVWSSRGGLKRSSCSSDL